MSDFTLTIKGDKALITALRDIAAAFAAAQIVAGAEGKEFDPAAFANRPTGAPLPAAAPVAELPTAAPTAPTAAPAFLTPETALAAPPAAPAAPPLALVPPPAATPAAPAVGANGSELAQVRAAISAFADRNGRDAAIGILAEFNSPSVSGLSPQHYAAVLQRIEALNAAPATGPAGV